MSQVRFARVPSEFAPTSSKVSSLGTMSFLKPRLKQIQRGLPTRKYSVVSVQESDTSDSSEGTKQRDHDHEDRIGVRKRIVKMMPNRRRSSRRSDDKFASEIVFYHPEALNETSLFDNDEKSLFSIEGETVIASNRVATEADARPKRTVKPTNRPQAKIIRETPLKPKKAIHWQNEYLKQFAGKCKSTESKKAVIKEAERQAREHKPTQKQISMWEKAKWNYRKLQESMKDIVLSTPLDNSDCTFKPAELNPVTPIFASAKKSAILKRVMKKPLKTRRKSSSSAQSLLSAVEEHDDMSTLSGFVQDHDGSFLSPLSRRKLRPMTSITIKPSKSTKKRSTRRVRSEEVNPGSAQSPLSQATAERKEEDLDKLLSALDEELHKLTTSVAVSVVSDDWIDDV